MKNLFVLLLLFMTNSVYAGSSGYYAALKTIVSTNGGGLVYASSEQEDDPDAYDIKSQTILASTIKDEPIPFFAYAKAESEYHFLGWSMSEDGVIVSKDNPYEVLVKASGTKTNDPNTTTVYAHFGKVSQGSYDVTLHSVQHGSFTVTINEDKVLTVDSNDQHLSLSGANEVTFTAKADDAWKFFGWYTIEDGKKRFLSYDTIFTTMLIGATDILAEFIEQDIPVFSVNTKHYIDLFEAIANTTNSNSVVTLVSDGVLSAGSYIIPEGITLLIPYDEFESYGIDAPKVVSFPKQYEHETIYKYRSLALATGVSLKVEGNLVVAAEQFAGHGNSVVADNICGGINGAYGYIWLNEGSSIEIAHGGNLSAWGFICGNGIITAKSGSQVYEPFLFGDWRGGDRTSQFGSDENLNYKVFPANQYYIQNIECSLVLESGASEIALASLWASETTFSSPIHFVGSEKAMFSLSEGSTLTKRYDPQTDRIVVDIQGNASVNSIVLTLDQGIEFSSELYTLPIGSSWDINILSGTTSINNDLCLVPGAKVTIAHESSAIVSNGKNVFVYDTKTWLEHDFVAGTNKVIIALYRYHASVCIGTIHSAVNGTKIQSC